MEYNLEETVIVLPLGKKGIIKHQLGESDFDNKVWYEIDIDGMVEHYPETLIMKFTNIIS